LVIHTHGWKAQRDREKLLAAYRGLLNHFMIKPLAEYELAKLDNFQLDRLCRDLYAKQKPRELRWYAQKMGHRSRTDEFRLRWFWHDLFHPKPKVKKYPVKPFVPLVMAKAAN
jgi:hypothetical protein